MSGPRPNKLLYFIVFIISFIQYANTLSYDFAWDDKIVIQENTRVQQGIAGIPELFKKYKSELRQDKYGYRPITLSTFAIDYEFFKSDPKGFHFMNVLYFAILCVVLFYAMQRIFYSHTILIPFLITILFAVHPIHSEVVSNIKSRDEILSLLFCLLSLIYIMKFYSSLKWVNLLKGSLLFLLAFLSKENSITFLAVYPLVLLLMGPFEGKKYAKTLIFIPVLTVICILIIDYASKSTLGIGQTSGYGAFNENNILGNSFFLSNNGISNKLANASHLNFLYLKDFIAPYPLVYYHGYGYISILGWESWKIILSFLMAIAALIFALFKLKKYPMISFGILFFYITISVYLMLFINLSDTMADRFMFMPSLGLCVILIAFLLPFQKEKLDTNSDSSKEKETILIQFTKLNRYARGGILFVLILFSFMTFSRNSVWKNDITLISHDMKFLSNSARPNYYYASLLNKQMMEEGWDDELETKMIFHYRKSMEISDSIYFGRLELGTYYCNRGKLNEGIKIFEEMTNLFPKASDPYFFLGQAYIDEKEYSKAIVALEKSYKYSPKNFDSYKSLAYAYSKAGNFEKGKKMAFNGITIFPESVIPFYELIGQIYFDEGDLENSTINTMKIIECGGNAYNVYATVIGRFQSVGDSENAALYYRTAIEKGIMQATPQ